MEMSNNTICRHDMTTINFYIVYIQTNISPLIFMQSHLQYSLYSSNSSLLDSKYFEYKAKTNLDFCILFAARILSSNLIHHEIEDFG